MKYTSTPAIFTVLLIHLFAQLQPVISNAQSQQPHSRFNPITNRMDTVVPALAAAPPYTGPPRDTGAQCTPACLGPNLVGNAGFETLTGCLPFSCDFPAGYCPLWSSPSPASPNIFNTCAQSGFDGCYVGVPYNLAGYRTPHSGNGYAGFCDYGSGDYREYLSAPLTQALQYGKTYYVEFYVSLGSVSLRAANNIGAYFSFIRPVRFDDYNFPYPPQILNTTIITDTLNWVKICGTFIPTTLSDYITIGNFSNDAGTDTVVVNTRDVGQPYAYYYIDDIRVSEVLTGTVPAPPVTLGNDTSFCNGQPISLTLDAGPGWASYLWNDSAVTESITVDTGGVYTVTVVDTNGCNSSGLIVVSQSNLQLSVISHDSCGGKGYAVAEVSSGEQQYQYTWSTGATTDTASNLNPNTYYVTVTDGAGCQARDSAVITGVGDSVTITANKTLFCPNDSVYLTVTEPFETYSWSNGATTRSIYTGDAGNYYVTVTNGSGCTAVSNHISITVYQPAAVVINASGDTLRVYYGRGYQWYFNGVAIPGDTLNYCIALNKGSYTVAVTDTNQCTAYSNPVVYTDIAGLSAETFEIYPNPLTNGQLQVNISNALVGGSLQIYDMDGRMIYSGKLEGTHLNLDLNLAAGVYLCKINSGSKANVTRLVKL